MCYICRVSKLCKKDILSALHHLSRNFHGTANCSLPEWHIEHMMKAKWNQCTLDNTKDQSSEISASCYQTAQRINTVLNYRPYKIHQNSYKHIYDCRNNRYKSGTAKEGQRIRKYDLMETVMKRCNAKTYDNTAKYTHLQRQNPAYRSNGSFQYICCNLPSCSNLIVDKKHRTDSHIHNKI